MEVKYTSSIEVKVPRKERGEIIKKALKELLDDIVNITPSINIIEFVMKDGGTGRIVIVEDPDDVLNERLRIVVEHKESYMVTEMIRRISEAITKAKEEVKEEEKKEESGNEAEEKSD